MGVLDDERAAAFAASYLAPIAEEAELVRTLQAFLGHHGSRLKVAEELGVHRNTVRNRLEQIEVALDGSLDDPQVRVNAWIALQVAAGRAEPRASSHVTPCYLLYPGCCKAREEQVTGRYMGDPLTRCRSKGRG